jgi:hypothetical protein
MEFEDVQPGEQIQESFTVTHDFAQDTDGTYPTVNFVVEARNFIQSDAGGSPQFVDIEDLPEQLRLSDWITVEPLEFSLSERGESQTITFTINVPEDATAGGRYGAIMVRQTSEGDVLENNIGAGLTSETGPLILLTVDGEIEKGIEISDFHVETIQGKETSLFWNPPVKAVITFKNTGNVHLAPRGVVFFHQGEITNERLFSTQLNETLTYILPGASRTYEFVWDPSAFIKTAYEEIRGDEEVTLLVGDEGYSDYPVKEVRYNTEIDSGNLSDLFFGEYKVTVQYAADNEPDFEGQETLTQSISFRILPLHMILAVGVPVILFVSALLFIFIRKRRRGNKNISTVEEEIVTNNIG